MLHIRKSSPCIAPWSQSWPQGVTSDPREHWLREDLAPYGIQMSHSHQRSKGRPQLTTTGHSCAYSCSSPLYLHLGPEATSRYNKTLLWNTCFLKTWYFCNTNHDSPDIYISVQFSRSVVSDSLPPHELQHSRLPCPSPTSKAYSNSCPLSQWCHPTISSFIIPFSSCLQSFPASGSFPMNQFLASGGQRIEASASVLPVNIQDWFPLGWTGLISLQSKGLWKWG